MKFLKNEKSKGFIMGIVFMVVLSVGVGSAMAAGKLAKINVSIGGITLYVDGKLTILKDSKGNDIDPIIYDGTTYLPLRAIANVFDKDITWDGKKSAIYLGEQPKTAQVDIAKVPMYDGDVGIQTGEYAQFNILNKTYTPFNRFPSNGGYTYILDSKYHYIQGEFVVPYTNLGNREEGTLRFYSVNSKGVETLIDQFTLEAGDEAIDVKVNIAGVNNLKIYTFGSYWSSDNYGTFYNVVLSQ